MQSSTEQLTGSSTGTLEKGTSTDTDEILAKRTVSEKIMSVCKNAIRWVLLLDVILALSVIVALSILEFGTIPQQHIGFYCNDPKISFKFMGDTISIALLIATSIAVPIIIVSIVEYMCHAADSYDIILGFAGTRVKQIGLWYGHYLTGMIALTFLCDIMKILIGEPRPHFLDTCRPREAENCNDEYVGLYTCTNTVDSAWFVSDSSKSFPSGHSALSMYTTIFIVWYLQNRMPNRTLFLKPWLQCMMCLWTVICSLTRIGDNRHHWWDVLAGNALGAFFGVLTVKVPCCDFNLKKRICNETVEHGQSGFNGRRHQNVKKLLNDPTIDNPEGRELKNISTSWKE